MNTTATQQTVSTGAVADSALLFVDDEENILSALKRLFRPLGYRVFVAPGGAQGLEVLERERIDLVISDMRMPQMDGAQFLAAVAVRWPGTVRILLTGYADINSTIEAINRGQIFRYISKPWEDNDIRLAVQHALERKQLEAERRRLEELTQRQNAELKEWNADLETKVAARTVDLRRTMEALQQAVGTLKRNYSASVKIFSNLIETRIGTAARLRVVAEQAQALAQYLELDKPAQQDVLFAALLRDIGKIGLPDALIRKPFNALTAEERAQVVKHPVLGEAALMALEPLRGAARLIRAQHERFDGQGYPDGLSGEAIPLGARVLAAVGDYHALQAGLLATQDMPAADARRFLADQRGRRYDPRVVDAYLELLGKADAVPPADRELRLKSGGIEAGMVLARDLISSGGILLLPKDCVLDEAVIERIYNFERTAERDLTIYVQPVRR